MSGAWRRLAAVSVACLLAAACAGTGDRVTPAPRAGVYKLGEPYTVAGVEYVHKEEPEYEATGTASWYGPKFHGRLTANGEVFDRNKLTAAHPTLPLPSNVKVTNLENGKEVVLRVNDRGPFAGGRLIDLSERAADVLGYKSQGLAQVRVTYLSSADGKRKGAPLVPPPRTQPDVATAIASTSTKVETASLVPIAVPVSTPVPEQDVHPVVGVTPYFVQAGAYTSVDNANRVVEMLKTLGASISAMMKNGVAIYRVRLGPFPNVGDAGAALVRVQQLGHNDARIVVD